MTPEKLLLIQYFGRSRFRCDASTFLSVTEIRLELEKKAGVLLEDKNIEDALPELRYKSFQVLNDDKSITQVWQCRRLPKQEKLKKFMQLNTEQIKFLKPHDSVYFKSFTNRLVRGEIVRVYLPEVHFFSVIIKRRFCNYLLECPTDRIFIKL